MKIPLYVQPPPTPIKSASCNNLNSKLIAEGSFYKIYKMRKNTVLRVSKRRVGELGLNEVEILRRIRRHPFINRMKKWWIEGGLMYFEMEECECNLNDVLNYSNGDSRLDLNSSSDSNSISSSDNRLDLNSSSDGEEKTKSGQSRNSSSDGSDEEKMTRSDQLRLSINNNTPLSTKSDITNNSFIVDPFSDSVAPCSTSVIVTDDSSEDTHNSTILDSLPVPGWINILMYQMSSALSHVHSKGIIHMDIKPENILIKDRSIFNNCSNSYSGEIRNLDNKNRTIKKNTATSNTDNTVTSNTVTNIDCGDKRELLLFKLCDFNISKIGEGCFNYDGDKIYMAPEILKNKCYFKSDIYSLGLIYLELINSRSLPREGEEYLKLRRNDFKGWKIDEIGRRMLEKNPENRCSSKEVKEYFQSRIG